MLQKEFKECPQCGELNPNWRLLCGTCRASLTKAEMRGEVKETRYSGGGENACLIAVLIEFIVVPLIFLIVVYISLTLSGC